MVIISDAEREVLMYLKSSLHHNRFQGVNASEISSNIDRPLKDVLDACELLDQKDLADIENREMAGGKAKGLEIHITNKGLDYLVKEKGIPL